MNNLMRCFVYIFIVITLFNRLYADPIPRINKYLIGIWNVENETIDSTYSGNTSIGQISFFGDEMTIDSGGVAALGIVSSNENSFCQIAQDPISYKIIGDNLNNTMYVSYLAKGRTGHGPFKADAVVTISIQDKNNIILIGQGGCGAVGTPRISYLGRVQ